MHFCIVTILLILYTVFRTSLLVLLNVVCSQPMEVFVDDETKLTLHGLQQYYCKLKDSEKNRKLFDLLDVLEFNQVSDIGLILLLGVSHSSFNTVNF